MNPRKLLLCLLVVLSISFGMATAGWQQPDACQSEEARNKPAITYRVGGGLTGSVTEWRVYPDGLVCQGSGVEPIRLVAPRLHVPAWQSWDFKEKGKLPPGKTAELLKEITRLGFFTLPDGNGLTFACEQCKRYRVTARSRTQKKTVAATDIAMPAAIKDVLAVIEGVLPRDTP